MMRLFVSMLLASQLAIVPLAPAQSAAPAAPVPAGSAPASRPGLDLSRGYHLEKGPYAVGEVKEIVLEDKARKKKLPLRIRFPKTAPAGSAADGLDPKTAARAKKRDDPASHPTPRAANRPKSSDGAGVSSSPVSPSASQPDAGEPERFPLIIFSHGAGGSSDAFEALSEQWASHGYVVVHPTHSDSIRLRRRQGEDLSGLRDDPQRLRTDVDPRDRLADVSFILDSIGELEQRVAGLKDAHGRGRVDRTRIGMSGHSAGAYTTQLAAGVKTRGLRLGRDRDELAGHADARIKAAVLISGQGLTNRSFTRESWKELALPMLTIAGSLDTSRISNETPASRRDPYEYAPSGDKYLIFIEGATHGSYQGRGLAALLGEKPTSDVDMITSSVAAGTLAFWDAYLKGSADGKAYLQSEKLMEMTAGQAQLSRK